MLARLTFFGLVLSGMTVFAACGGSSSDDDDDDPTPTVEATATAVKDLTPQEIVAQMNQSVVHIKATYPEGTGGGSGIV